VQTTLARDARRSSPTAIAWARIEADQGSGRGERARCISSISTRTVGASGEGGPHSDGDLKGSVE
jgi:hypothetical protein